MNKKFILLFVFAILVEAISTHEITKISNVVCDYLGKETFNLEVTPSGSMEDISEFTITLKNGQDENQKPTAKCALSGLDSDMLIGSDGLDSKVFSSDKENELSDLADKSQEVDGSSEPNNEMKDSLDTDMVDKESDVSNAEKEGNSDMEDLSDSMSIDKGRRLEEVVSPVTYECTLQDTVKSGNYQIDSVDNSALTSGKDVAVDLYPCVSENKAKERLNIGLSFRQVSGFLKDKFTFNFYGLTKSDIEKNAEISFWIFLFIGTEKKLNTIEVKCITADGATIPSDNPIAKVEFTCTIPEDNRREGLESIEIASSEQVAGLPTDETLLNPKLTDDAINDKKLVDKSQLDPPQFPTFNGVNTDSDDEGIIEFTLIFEKELPEKMQKGKTFEMTLNYPSGLSLMITIAEIKDMTVTFNVEILGAVNDLSLMFEQTVISVDGEELFILPSFSTEHIKTEGYPKSLDSYELSSDNKVDEGEGKSSTEESSENGKLTSDENPEEGTDQDGQISDSPSLEEQKKIAEERLLIFITFRQINGFLFESGTISFNFYALITQSLPKSHSITLSINLISSLGMEENTTIVCTTQSDFNVKNEETQQALFLCKMEVSDKSKIYTGLRLINSEEVAGIPYDDETALNPALTDEAIKNGEIKDAKDSPIPPTFEFEIIDNKTCNVDGKFSIKGKLDKETTIPNKFTLPLTFPPNVVITCTFGKDGILCIADEQLNNELMIEQQIVTDGADELFILKKVDQKDIKCENGLKIQAEEKLKVDISFRQVSHIEQKSGGNGFTFFFAAFVNADLPKNHIVDMKVIVIIKEQKVEKVAKCTLGEEVKATEGKKTQADFNCEVALEENEEAKPEDLSISTNNENIGGCEELSEEELSPSLTQKAIDEKSDNPLVQVLDYQLEENKNKVPPTFTLDSMNFNKCITKGKIKIEGQFSEAITEEMTFELPFTFPKTKVKCTVESAEANKPVQITCKMQKIKGGLKFTDLVIEPRLLKKKCMEMLYIEQKKVTLDKEQSCQDYNEIKKKHAKERLNADFTFLQLGRPRSYTSGLFFLALTKKMFFTGSFTKITISVTLTVENSRRRRNLDTLELDDPISVTCNPKSDAQTDNSGALDCSSDNENRVPVSSEFEDNIIGGAPEKITVDENPNPDYSTIEGLNEFDSLPSITINDITSDNCVNTGKYKIDGTYKGELANSDIKHNIKIPFATPDSSGLCTMSVDQSDKKIQLICDNTEFFDVSEIMISPQAVNNETDSTPLFKITNDFTAPSQFACAISDDSLPPNAQNPENGNDSNDPGNDGNDGGVSKAGKTKYSKNSSGLGGGAIAGIVIACVVVVGIVGALIALGKSGAFASKSAVTAASIDNSSTVNRFKMDEQNPNMV